MTTIASTQAAAAEFVATEIAWWGCCNERLVAEKLAKAGYTAEASDILAFAIEAGLVTKSPIGYHASKRTNAKVFGRKFAEWVVA